MTELEKLLQDTREFYAKQHALLTQYGVQGYFQDAMSDLESLEHKEKHDKFYIEGKF